MGKSMSARRSGRNGRTDIMEIWHTPKHHWTVQVIGAVIRWRAEIITALVLVTALSWVNSQTSTLVMWLTLGGTVAAVAAVGPARRFAVGRMWCVLDRHRLRTCLRNAKVRTMNLDGALPFMLWARPTRTGERIWLWIRAGSSGDDIEDALSYIAPACYARSARLHRPKKITTVVAVEIVRRNPLDTSEPITSPLTRLTGLLTGNHASGGDSQIAASDATTVLSEPLSTTSVEPAPSEPKPARNGTRPSPKKQPTNGASPDRDAVFVGGEDVSDYID